MAAHLLNDLRRVLTLLAGFAIAMHVAVFLHETGHALGAWLGGGKVSAIVMLAPMPAGYVLPRAPDSYGYVWGGVVFGSLVALVPLAAAQRFSLQSPLRFLALLTAAFCLGHNAIYLFVGGIVPFGDAEDMIGLGAPQWALLMLGIPLLIGFAHVLSRAIQPVGFRPVEPLWRCVLIVEAGLLTIPALMVAVLLFSPSAHSMRVPMLMLLATYALSFAIATIRTRSAGSGGPDFGPPGWGATVGSCAAALLLIAGESLALGPPRHRDVQQQWEITVENQSDRPCSFFVTLGSDGHNNVKVEHVGRGQSLSLCTGLSNTVIRTVKSLSGGEEETLAPNTALPVGKKYAITVEADGKLKTSLLAR